VPLRTTCWRSCLLVLRTSRCRSELLWNGSVASRKADLQSGRGTSYFLSELRYASRSVGHRMSTLARRTSRLRPWMQPRWEALGVQKIHSPTPRLLARRQRHRTLALGSAANRALASCRADPPIKINAAIRLYRRHKHNPIVLASARQLQQLLL
jgi:hypothetical protein